MVSVRLREIARCSDVVSPWRRTIRWPTYCRPDQRANRNFEIVIEHHIDKFRCFLQVLEPHYDFRVRQIFYGIKNTGAGFPDAGRALCREYCSKAILVSFSERSRNVARKKQLALVQIQKIRPLRMFPAHRVEEYQSCQQPANQLHGFVARLWTR